MPETPDQTINQLQAQITALKQQLKEAQDARLVAERDAAFVVWVEEDLLAPRTQQDMQLMRELEEAKTRAYARIYANIARAIPLAKALKERR